MIWMTIGIFAPLTLPVYFRQRSPISCTAAGGRPKTFCGFASRSTMQRICSDMPSERVSTMSQASMSAAASGTVPALKPLRAT